MGTHMRLRVSIVEDHDVREDEAGFVLAMPLPEGGGVLDAGTLARLAAALAPADRRGYRDRLVVKNGGRLILLRTDDIDCVEAEGNYVLIRAGGETHILRETIGSLEVQLDPSRFRRIHRSAIVNVDRIKELRPQAHGDVRVLLKSGAQLTLSRSYRDGLFGLLGPSQ
jgi:two-component system LytT family response regulator